MLNAAHFPISEQKPWSHPSVDLVSAMVNITRIERGSRFVTASGIEKEPREIFCILLALRKTPYRHGALRRIRRLPNIIFHKLTRRGRCLAPRERLLIGSRAAAAMTPASSGNCCIAANYRATSERVWQKAETAAAEVAENHSS
jgi:hypothetical protein